MKFRLALAQMQVVGGDTERNLERAEQIIAQAARGGADLVLLPETMDVGWTNPSARERAEPIPGGGPASRLRAAALRHRIYVCAGLTEREGDSVYNSAVLIDRDGAVRGLHRKLNELEIAHAAYDPGDRLGVVQTEFGVFGMMICADALAGSGCLARSLCLMGAEVILSPCSWAVPPRHDTIREPYGDLWRRAYMPVASSFSVWIAAASNVGVVAGGPWGGHECIGSSLLIDAQGNEVLTGPYGVAAEALLYADVETRRQRVRGTG